MKIIFLDFDGVLNSRAFENAYPPAQSVGLAPNDRWIHAIDPAAVELLNGVVRGSGAKVVISSTWRRGFPIEKIRAFLVTRGFEGEVIDVTPSHVRAGAQRGDEIQAWLDNHPEVTAFVILDDVDDMAHLLDRLVRTDIATGLRAEHCTKALELLSR